MTWQWSGNLVLTILRTQFSSYKSFISYFRILMFILVDSWQICWEHLGIICLWQGLVLSQMFWNKKWKNLENKDVLIYNTTNNFSWMSYDLHINDLYILQSDNFSSVTFTTHPSIIKQLSSYISYFPNFLTWPD